MGPRSFPSRLNAVDATLWEIERDPALRTTIVALGLLDRTPSPGRLRATVEEAVTRIPRLRQRVQEAPIGLGRPRWIDAQPDLSYHLRRVALPSPGDGRALLDVCSWRASEGFDRERPLWEISLVEGLAAGRAALVLKVHHAVTDGVGGVALLQALSDNWSPGEPRDGPSPRDRGFSDAAILPVRLAARAARLALHPVGTAGAAISTAESARRMLWPSGPPLSSVWTERGLSRWTEALDAPLDSLVDAAHRSDGTVNDVFVAIVLEGLARLHELHGSPTQALRVTLPISSRRPDDPAGGNQWTPARLVMPLHFDERRERFDAYRARIRSVRREPALALTHALAEGIHELPSALTTGLVAGMVKGADVAITNIPGPTEPISIGDVALERLYPFAPTGGAALNVGLLSHDDRACIGFTIDTSAVEDPLLLVRCVQESLEDYLAKPPTGPRNVESPAPEPAAEHQVGGPTEQTESASGRSRLSALDTSFLRIESPTSPMHMGALFVLDGEPLVDQDGRLRLDELRQLIADRAAAVTHLRQRAAEVPLGIGRPVWVRGDEVDIEHHVRAVELSSPGSLGQLLATTEQLMMERLDRSRPLWELWFVTGQADGRIGLVEKLHHALLDGMSGVELLAVLFDPASGGRPESTSPSGAGLDTGSVPGDPNRTQLALEALGEQLRDPLAIGQELARSLSHPRAAARDVGAVAGAVKELSTILPARSHTTSLARPLSHHRRLIPVVAPLDPVHRAATTLGGTVNDIVLAAVTSGLRGLLLDRGELDSVPHLRALVPVSTRRSGMHDEPGNRVSAVVVDLPVADSDPLARLHTVEARMKHLKRAHRADGAEHLLGASDHLWPGVVDALAHLIDRQPFVDLVVTNMPGPPESLHLMGARVEELYPVVPLGPNMSIGVAVVSYRDQLVIAIHGDRAACPDLEVMAGGIAAELDELMARAESEVTS